MIYTAEDVITESMMMIRDFQKERYLEATMYFGQAYRDFQLYSSSALKRVWVKPSPIHTIPFPDDYLGFQSIGIACRGKLSYFMEVDQLPTRDDKLECVESDREKEAFRLDVGKTNFCYDTHEGEYAGYGDPSGYIFVDYEKRRIQLKKGAVETFKNVVDEEVMLTYKSGDLKDLSHSLIGMEHVNLLASYIAYKLTLSAPEAFEKGMINMRKSDYLEELSKFHENKNSFTYDQLVDTLVSTFGYNTKML